MFESEYYKVIYYQNILNRKSFMNLFLLLLFNLFFIGAYAGGEIAVKQEKILVITSDDKEDELPRTFLENSNVVQLYCKDWYEKDFNEKQLSKEPFSADHRCRVPITQEQVKLLNACLATDQKFTVPCDLRRLRFVTMAFEELEYSVFAKECLEKYSELLGDKQTLENFLIKPENGLLPVGNYDLLVKEKLKENEFFKDFKTKAFAGLSLVESAVNPEDTFDFTVDEKSFLKIINASVGKQFHAKVAKGYPSFWLSVRDYKKPVNYLNCDETLVKSMVITDNEVIAGCGDGAIQVRAKDSGELQNVFPSPCGGFTGCYPSAFCLINDDLFAGGYSCGKIILWNRKTNATISIIENNSASICSLVCVPPFLIASSRSGFIKIWDVKKACLIKVLKPSFAGPIKLQENDLIIQAAANPKMKKRIDLIAFKELYDELEQKMSLKQLLILLAYEKTKIRLALSTFQAYFKALPQLKKIVEKKYYPAQKPFRSCS